MFGMLDVYRVFRWGNFASHIWVEIFKDTCVVEEEEIVKSF